MQPILANYTASITELKKSPTQLLKDAGDEAIAILNHNVPSALSSAIQKCTKVQSKNVPLCNTYLLEISNKPASLFCFNL